MAVASPWGLVLAGGMSVRLGADKGSRRYHGEPQVLRSWRLLGSLCERAYVAVRAAQAGQAPYVDLPVSVDRPGDLGPAAGVRAAAATWPGVAWLVLATDLPHVDETLLRALLAARRPDRDATAYRHADGTVEPLCAIWEPPLLSRLLELPDPAPSLRLLLESGSVETLVPSDPQRLRSVNTPEEERAAIEFIARERP